MAKSVRVILVTGDAPYLGGPATWKPLRQALPEFDCVEVDLLNLDAEYRLAEAARDHIQKALAGAQGIIAHGTAARLAIESAAAVDPTLPVLLLSPRMVTRSSPVLSLIRHLAGGVGGGLLASVARRKRRRLLDDSPYIWKQLRLLVREDVISEELVNEARGRIADARMTAIVDRTAEMLHDLLTPLDARTSDAVSRRMVLLGEGPVDRRVLAREGGTVLSGAWSAPMLESPEAVADCVRSFMVAADSRA